MMVSIERFLRSREETVWHRDDTSWVMERFSEQDEHPDDHAKESRQQNDPDDARVEVQKENQQRR